VRPIDNSSRLSDSLNQSVAGYRPRKSILVKDVLPIKEVMQDSGTNQQQPPKSTRSIIQHYNTLSKTSKPTSNLLGARRHGIAAHRIEKKTPPARPGASSFYTSIQGRDSSDSAGNVEPTQVSVSLHDINHSKGLQRAKESMAGSSWSSKTTAPRAADTFGAKSIRQDRGTTFSSTKKQEEVYLAQARLMQWYLMNKRAVEHFAAQEKSAEVII
jgi:hypothetical protein